jgi:hypothetical protein
MYKRSYVVRSVSDSKGSEGSQGCKVFTAKAPGCKVPQRVLSVLILPCEASYSLAMKCCFKPWRNFASLRPCGEAFALFAACLGKSIYWYWGCTISGPALFVRCNALRLVTLCINLCSSPIPGNAFARQSIFNSLVSLAYLSCVVA